MANEPGGEARMRALIDHELYHLIAQLDEDTGHTKKDDQGRPLFKMRKHDWTFAGFRAVAQRHGRTSQEVIQARQLHDAYGNILFDFASDMAVARPKDSDLVRDTFAALLSVGHTEAMARRAIDAVLADGTAAATVAEMIDAIYLKQKVASGDFVDQVFDQVAAEVNSGALGPDVTATVTKRSRRKVEPGVPDAREIVGEIFDEVVAKRSRRKPNPPWPAHDPPAPPPLPRPSPADPAAQDSTSRGLSAIRRAPGLIPFTRSRGNE
jgi:hypothetical protein